MLVLTRKENEEIYIETPVGRIRVVVVMVDRGRVKIGVDAPRTMAVLRSELVDDKPPQPGGGR